LVALAPDVILVTGGATEPLLQATRTVPVVFVGIADPVGAGFAESLARPGGNATGFMTQEYGLAGKHLELLKEIVPDVTRVGVVRDSSSIAGIGQFGAIQSIAPSLNVELSPLGLRDKDEIERGITAFARRPNSGLVVTGTALTVVHRDLIIALAARHKLPAVYSFGYFARAGGLISYGADIVDHTGVPPATSIASSGARNPPTCRCRRRRSTS
jgi:putative ABC transport system substrate-binding protein